MSNYARMVYRLPGFGYSNGFIVPIAIFAEHDFRRIFTVLSIKGYAIFDDYSRRRCIKNGHHAYHIATVFYISLTSISYSLRDDA